MLFETLALSFQENIGLCDLLRDAIAVIRLMKWILSGFGPNSTNLSTWFAVGVAFLSIVCSAAMTAYVTKLNLSNQVEMLSFQLTHNRGNLLLQINNDSMNRIFDNWRSRVINDVTVFLSILKKIADLNPPGSAYPGSTDFPQQEYLELIDNLKRIRIQLELEVIDKDRPGFVDVLAQACKYAKDRSEMDYTYFHSEMIAKIGAIIKQEDPVLLGDDTFLITKDH